MLHHASANATESYSTENRLERQHCTSMPLPAIPKQLLLANI